MTQNALAVQRATGGMPAPEEWATMLQMAEALVASGLLPAHIKTPAAAVTIMQLGRELGVPPMLALSNIAHIQGKPTANSQLMLALVYRDHGDGALQVTRTGDDACEITYRRRSWAQPQRFTYTMSEAKRAGLSGSATWTKYPAAMLRARAISAVCRLAFPDTIGGVYLPDELSHDGDVMVMNVQPPAPANMTRGDSSGTFDASGVVIDTTIDPMAWVDDDGVIHDDGADIRAAVEHALAAATEATTNGALRLAWDAAVRAGVADDDVVRAAFAAARDRNKTARAERQPALA